MSKNQSTVRLTRAEKKQIEAILARHKPVGKKEKSAQQSVPYERVYQDGICKVDKDFYSKTILFDDINYQLEIGRAHV